MRKIITEANEDWIYMKFHMFQRGLVEPKEIKDDLIYDLQDNGIIILKFENDAEYFDLFGWSSYQIRTLEHIFSYYGGGYEYLDTYTADDDWREGYLFNYFNEENRQLLEEIKEIISPELDLDDRTDLGNFSKTLNDFFGRLCDDIVSEYVSGMNSAIEETLKNAVREDICDIFMTDGIYNTGKSCFYKYYTTVDNLIKIYDRFNDKSSDILGILKKLGLEKGIEDNAYEDWYEFSYQDKFDEEYFNSSVNRYLEQMKEQLFDSDTFKDIEEYKKVRESLVNFKFGTWYNVPKNKKMMFKIIGVEPETNNIIFEYKQKGTQDFHKGSVNMERFNLFLYHPELF